MVRPTRAQTDTGSVVEPEPSAFRLFLRDLQPLPSPDALHPLGVDVPPFRVKQGSDTPVTAAAILARQADDRSRESLFVRTSNRNLPLGRSMLADRSTGSTLRYAQSVLKMLDTVSATGGA